MPLARKRYFWMGLAVLLGTLALDQATKWLVIEKILTPQRPGIEVTSFFNMVLVWNYGISFGMFASHRQPLLLLLMSVAIVSILLIWLYKNTSSLVAVALGCVMGGAIGNMIDRVRYSAVADFLDFHIGTYHWPAFNIADSTIFIGVVLLCGSSMFTERKNHP